MLIDAIIIKKTCNREHDQLVTLYTRQLGKMTAIAKSIFKPHSVQALALDEGNLIQCELVSGKGAPIITGAQAVRCFSTAKSSHVHWAAAQFFLQVMDIIVFDQEADEELWDCIGQTLDVFDQAHPKELLAIFQERQKELLHVLGYGHVEAAFLNQTYEQIAQKRFMTLELFYGMVNHYAR